MTICTDVFEQMAELEKRALGQPDAYLYGAPGTPGATGGIRRLNAFFLLVAEPEAYNLPRAPSRPARNARPSLLAGLATMAGLAVAALALGVGRGGR